jgi:hypothetical protein
MPPRYNVVYTLLIYRLEASTCLLFLHPVIGSVKLPRGLRVRLERFQVMAIVWERRKMLPAGLR